MTEPFGSKKLLLELMNKLHGLMTKPYCLMMIPCGLMTELCCSIMIPYGWMTELRSSTNKIYGLLRISAVYAIWTSS